MKKLICGCLTTLLCLGLTTSAISATEIEGIGTDYNENQVLVFNEEKNVYEVKDASSVIQPRYIMQKKLDFKGIIVTCNIYVDNNTGRIYTTGIEKSNNKYAAKYNVTINSNNTIAYFTVTIYSYDLFGGVGSPLGTKYVTVSSIGPM